MKNLLLMLSIMTTSLFASDNVYVDKTEPVIIASSTFLDNSITGKYCQIEFIVKKRAGKDFLIFLGDRCYEKSLIDVSRRHNRQHKYEHIDVIKDGDNEKTYKSYFYLSKSNAKLIEDYIASGTDKTEKFIGKCALKITEFEDDYALNSSKHRFVEIKSIIDIMPKACLSNNDDLIWQMRHKPFVLGFAQLSQLFIQRKLAYSVMLRLLGKHMAIAAKRYQVVRLQKKLLETLFWIDVMDAKLFSRAAQKALGAVSFNDGFSKCLPRAGT